MEPPNGYQCFSYSDSINRPKFGYMMSQIWYEPTILEFEAGIFATAQWPSKMGRLYLESDRFFMSLWKERISVSLLGLFRRRVTWLRPFLCLLLANEVLFQIGKHSHPQSRTRNGARYMEVHVGRGVKWNLPSRRRSLHLLAMWQHSSPTAGCRQACRAHKWRNIAIGLLVCERVMCPRLNRSDVRTCSEDDGRESEGWVGEIKFNRL